MYFVGFITNIAIMPKLDYLIVVQVNGSSPCEVDPGNAIRSSDNPRWDNRTKGFSNITGLSLGKFQGYTDINAEFIRRRHIESLHEAPFSNEHHMPNI